MWKTRASVFLDWMYPPVCLICGDLLPLDKENRNVCTHCNQDLPFILGSVCSNCGRPLELGGICPRCDGKKFPFRRGIAVFPYENLRFAIKHFKFKGCKEDSVPLGKWMADYLIKYYPDIKEQATMLVPVPVHKKRERNRGFNQAALLAEEISRNMGTPCVCKQLLRCKETIPQSKLDYTQRRLNCKDAFLAADNSIFKEQVILLVDDIFTTGATLDACATELYKAGAAEVIPFCLSIVIIDEQY